MKNRSRIQAGVVMAFVLLIIGGLAWEVIAQTGQTPQAPQTQPAHETTAEQGRNEGEGVVHIGMLVYSEDKTGVCFADGFLDTVARETDVAVHRQFEHVTLSSDKLFDYPFVVMTGQGRFTLDDTEIKNLQTYLKRGGFILASAGCTNEAWAESFSLAMTQAFGKDALQTISTKHPIFHTIYDIKHLDVRGQEDVAPLYAYQADGVVRVMFSPMGLNDTSNAGEGCCCCGGSEIHNAKLINADILVYALTH